MTGTPRPPLKKGDEFNELTAVRFVDRQNGHQRWLFSCKCGGKKVAQYGNVFNGVTTSCGCVHKKRTSEANKRHGRSESLDYAVWSSMKSRCLNKNDKAYDNYGGRGIAICSRWLDPKRGFENFMEDMGPRPPRYSIERKDNNLGYNKENCIWIPLGDQSNNRRVTVKLTLNGVTKPMTVWAKELGKKPQCLRARMRYGWKDERILTTP
jgi:hypothetical protein